MNYYIASCVFTTQYPELSFRIQEYIAKRDDVQIVRCCVPQYKLQEFSGKVPESLRSRWEALPDSAAFGGGDTVYSLCHNCSAIIDEWRPGAKASSLWELILQDPDFAYPDYKGKEIFVQDCWRARDRREEQDAVRELLRRMNFQALEQQENYEKTAFCGISLLRPAPPRNLKLAPKRFVDGAQGLFLPHTEAEQKAMMEAYGSRFGDREVAAYCHYCVEGLLLGGVRAKHLAELLFV
ncbi:MAG: hypothetical protein IJ860_00365 [Eubacterium sp.]|nr:hypothetical protein [Eubacterium sp.]